MRGGGAGPSRHTTRPSLLSPFCFLSHTSSLLAHTSSLPAFFNWLPAFFNWLRAFFNESAGIFNESAGTFNESAVIFNESAAICELQSQLRDARSQLRKVKSCGVLAPFTPLRESAKYDRICLKFEVLESHGGENSEISPLALNRKEKT